jgi:hypothetical protein
MEYKTMKTKRNLIQIWLLCAAMLPAAVQAQFSYTNNGDGTAAITQYTGPGGSVTIPTKFGGLTVTSIGDYAFFTCTSLNSVTIPNSVTGISTGAFSYCSSLTSVCFAGNAPTPSNDSFVFYGDDKAAVYYQPGTTGWDATFDGLPTALWLPQAQTSDGTFGVQSNQFGFNIDWASGRVVVVEVATNLANPVWSPVSTNTLTDSCCYFCDPQWTNSPGRFYRLRSP